MTTTPENGYLLTGPDLALLESVADKISGPIIEAIAAVAMERDKILDVFSQGQVRVAALETLLAGLVDLLNAQGFAPTFAWDRDVWEEAQAVVAGLAPVPDGRTP